jgi:hypothetical protein
MAAPPDRQLSQLVYSRRTLVGQGRSVKLQDRGKCFGKFIVHQLILIKIKIEKVKSSLRT